LKIEDIEIISGESHFFACRHPSHPRILQTQSDKIEIILRRKDEKKKFSTRSDPTTTSTGKARYTAPSSNVQIDRVLVNNYFDFVENAGYALDRKRR
jgi:hypothetical protein